MSHQEYSQYLLVSQLNYTLTNYANHSEVFSHDQINRYLKGVKLPPRMTWDAVASDIIVTPDGYIVFDDTVLDKRHSFAIELVRRQYSGNAKGVIKGIGVVTCIYVNPTTNQYWLIDYRVYAPEDDGKTKLEHVEDMLTNVHYHKQLSYRAVLMDSWYATQKLMRFIEGLNKIYYCPLKSNRLVDDSEGQKKYQRLDTLEWSTQEQEHGKSLKIKGFPKDHKVRCFRVAVSTHRTEWIVTNDPAQNTTQAIRQVCAWRWKIEQLHRETKQLTGIEQCQCRLARIQRNHIAAAFLVWTRLTQLAHLTGNTLYQLKYGLLDNYLRQQLRQPDIAFN